MKEQDKYGSADKIKATESIETTHPTGQTIPYLEDGIPIYPISPTREKAFYKECAIAGWNFHHPETFWEYLHEGCELALVRERKNPHDKNAVAVTFAEDYDGDPEDFDFEDIIGYVPRSENGVIAQLMDMGWNDVFTAKITTLKNEGHSDQRLRMTIYIQSKETTDSGPLFFAIYVDEERLQHIEDELFTKGNTYCRWGGFPIWHNLLPCEKDKVAIIHKDGNGATLYLLHCLAKGDNVQPFIDDIGELYRCDDCLPFILTNIKGPVRVSLDDIAFLNPKDISEAHPTLLTSQDTVTQLGKLFE